MAQQLTDFDSVTGEIPEFRLHLRERNCADAAHTLHRMHMNLGYIMGANAAGVPLAPGAALEQLYAQVEHEETAFSTSCRTPAAVPVE